MFACYDDNFFATQFHIDMFLQTFKNKDMPVEYQQVDEQKIKKVGWPMEYLEGSLTSYKNMDKKDIILFPTELLQKTIRYFRRFKSTLTQYEFIVCQEKELTKNEYPNLLGQAKMVFSANLQETLGISWYEGALVGALSLVPDRLSYSEMAIHEFKYPKYMDKKL